VNARESEDAERDLEQRYDGMKEGSKERVGGKGQHGRAGKHSHW